MFLFLNRRAESISCEISIANLIHQTGMKPVFTITYNELYMYSANVNPLDKHLLIENVCTHNQN